jgi:hypothetical protein
VHYWGKDERNRWLSLLKPTVLAYKAYFLYFYMPNLILMDRKAFQEFHDKNRDKFIAGIHNYCDRWCERCAFTSKCSVFAMEEQRSNKSEEKPDAFLEVLSENLKLAMEMLKHIAEEKGIDLNNLENDAQYQIEEKKRREFADKHILSIQSKDYSDRARKWFQENENVLVALSDRLNQNESLGITNENTLKEADLIEDAIEVINWYNFQIHVKLMRALQHELDLEYEDRIQNDANGSAKVALLGTEKSLAAWGVLLQNFPEQEDSIFPVLLLLEKIRKGISVSFPDVDKFIRPGFDE